MRKEGLKPTASAVHVARKRAMSRRNERAANERAANERAAISREGVAGGDVPLPIPLPLPWKGSYPLAHPAPRPPRRAGAKYVADNFWSITRRHGVW